MLWLLWVLSIALVSIALLVMIGLIITRLWRTEADARREIRRQSIFRSLIVWLDGGLETSAFLKLIETSPDVSAQLFFEFFELIRGEDSDRLRRLCEQAGIAHAQRQILLSRVSQRRRDAAGKLFSLGSSETVSALSKVLDDPVRSVQLAAARSLALLGAVVPLKKIAQISEGGENSLLLALVLKKVAGTQTRELLEIISDKRRLPQTRADAMAALAYAGDLNAAAIIGLQAADPSSTLRGAVADALASLGHPDGKAIVARLLYDKVWQVREKAARAAGLMGMIEYLPMISKLTLDETWAVRAQATTALSSLRTDSLKIFGHGPRNFFIDQAVITRNSA